MAKIDALKEKLAELRRWQNYFITILIALVAFIATQYQKTDIYLIVASVVSVIVMFICIVVFYLKIKKLIKEIEQT